MNAKVVKAEQGPDGKRVYTVDARGAELSVEIYPGDQSVGERPWHSDIRFVAEEEDLTGGDKSPRSAFLAAVSRHETMVRAGHSLPAVAWADIVAALEGAGAFAEPASTSS
jgi:hypothetical protein